jgi:hypothetical protein
MICAVCRLARFTEIFKVSKCGKTKLLIGQHLSSRIYEENSDNLRRYHEWNSRSFGKVKGVSPKGVSPDYLQKSGYGLGFCPVEAMAD